MHVPSFVSEPQVQFLSSLLEEIKRGHLQIPRFQRPFVWTHDQQLELLRSIRDGIPIGALLVWRTHNSSLACYDRLGPYRLASPPRGEGAVHQYLLDGHQRLSTLYAALHRPDDEPQDPQQVLPFRRAFINLETRDFWLAPLEAHPDIAKNTPRYLPLSALLDSIHLVRLQRQLPASHADRWIRASDEVARAFREYKIAVLPFVSEDLDLATATFRRINSQGTVMSGAHMIRALTWSSTFDLLQRISELKERHLRPLGWHALDDEQVLDVCKMVLDLHVGPTTAEKLGQELRARPKVLEVAMLAIADAARFFNERCSIHAPELVPHPVQLTLLAETFRSCPGPSEPAQDLLRAWLWLSTYTELFTGSDVEGCTLQALDDLRFMARNAQPRWTVGTQLEKRPLPSILDTRSPRAKALAVRLAERSPSRSHADGSSTAQALAKEGYGVSFEPFFILQEMVPYPTSQSPGGHFLLLPAHMSLLMDFFHMLTPLENLSSLELQTVKDLHVISEEALLLFRAGHYDAFIEQRRRDLDALEDAFFAPLAARFQPALRGS